LSSSISTQRGHQPDSALPLAPPVHRAAGARVWLQRAVQNDGALVENLPPIITQAPKHQMTLHATSGKANTKKHFFGFVVGAVGAALY